MRYLFVTLFLSFGLNAAASTGTVLLNCNVQGADQQVTVVRDRGQLILKELTDRGSWIERELTDKEWNEKTIRLSMGRDELLEDQTALDDREPYYYVIQFTKENQRWMFDYRLPSWRQIGMADCW